MSAFQIEPRRHTGRHTGTHFLDGISWGHVSHSNGAQEVHSHSQPGWDFMKACQPFKWSPGGAQPLTPWMGFHGGMSAIQMEPRRCTATHKLDGISWGHVSHSNGAQEVHSHSQPGWDFMKACQPFKWSPGGAQPLTPWMGFHGGMSAIQMEPRRCTATHKLDGISWGHVSHSNGAQEVHSHSQPGWDFMKACQPFKWSPGGAQPLTPWMGFHGGMSAIQMEPRRCTATHKLDGISWGHVSHSNGAQEVHSHSHPGWDFMGACQPFKWSPGGAQPLTPWMGFHGRMSAIQMEPRRCTGTHSLDGISWGHVSHSNGPQEVDSHSLSGWDFSHSNGAQEVHSHSLPGWD